MIVELHDSSDLRMGETLRLAHRLFSPETREPDAVWIDEIEGRRPGTVRFFVWDEGGVRGFCRAAWLSVGTMIVHLGVDEAWQGRGTGTHLLREVQRSSGDRPIFAEVEAGPARDWWQGKGARVLVEEYVQPALRGETPPVPMALMAIGEVDDAEEAVRAIYREFYGLGEDDPLVRRVLGGVTA